MSLLQLLELLVLLLLGLVLQPPVRMLTRVRLQEVRGMVSMEQATELVTLLDTGDTPRRMLIQQMRHRYVLNDQNLWPIAATSPRNQPTAGRLLGRVSTTSYSSLSWPTSPQLHLLEVLKCITTELHCCNA